MTPQLIRLFAVLAPWCLVQAVAAQGKLETSGDLLEFGLPLAALTTAYLHQDTDGEQQWLFSTGTTLVATAVTKQAFANTAWGTGPKTKEQSFPSGHTAIACSGAAFLNDRYGWTYGAPAYALAGVVAYSRVNAHEHYWRDVLAGCGLAALSSYYWVSPQHQLQLSPQITSTGLGLAVSGHF